MSLLTYYRDDAKIAPTGELGTVLFPRLQRLAMPTPFHYMVPRNEAALLELLGRGSWLLSLH